MPMSESEHVTSFKSTILRINWKNGFCCLLQNYTSPNYFFRRSGKLEKWDPTFFCLQLVSSSSDVRGLFILFRFKPIKIEVGNLFSPKEFFQRFFRVHTEPYLQLATFCWSCISDGLGALVWWIARGPGFDSSCIQTFVFLFGQKVVIE